MMKRVFLILFCTMVSFLFFSCGKKNMNSKSKILKTSSTLTCHSFHPQKTLDAADATICKALYEGLTRVDLKGNVDLALAEKVEISSCKKIYTFTLRFSKWSNGKAIVSKHFTEAWKTALDPKNGITRQARKLFIIRNAKQIYEGNLTANDLAVYSPNDQTVVVELEHPAPYFLQLLAEPVYSPIFDINEAEPTIFNGPFNVEQFEIDKKLVLKKNPLYWDAKSVKLEGIQISSIKDGNTAFSMYEKGDLDWIGTPFSEVPVQSLRSISSIKNLNTSSPFWIYFNVENNKLKSANMRKALAYAVDRSEIVKKIALFQKELYTIIPTEVSYVDSSSYISNYNLENAKALFAKGLKELELEKEEITLTLNHSNYDLHEKIAVYLKDLWEKTFGIKITLRKDDWKTFYGRLVSNDYDIGGCYVCNLYNHPSSLLDRFEGSYISTWSNSSFKQLFRKAKYATKESEQYSYFKQAEEILMEEMPVIALYNQNNLFVCKDNLKNAFPSKFTYADFKWAYFED